MTAPRPSAARPSAGVTPEQLATLSHEFRTPLNGVLGMARLLEGTRLTGEQRAYVTALRESGDHLLSLVNDVLDFARLGATADRPEPAPVDVEGLLRQVAELMSPRAHEKGVEIAWAVSPGLPTILADEGRLRQILLNYRRQRREVHRGGRRAADRQPGRRPGALLGGRHRTRRRARSPRQDLRGLRPDRRQPPHPAGRSGPGPGHRRPPGRAMDGEAGVGGEVGQGADFWFEAPFEIASPYSAGQPLAGKAVAVASPNAIVRIAAARQIEAAGGRAFVAADVASALSTAPADAVLLIDAALAGPRGALKPPAGRRAVVLLTPDQRGRIDRLKTAGFTGYLIKPLRAASIVAQVLQAGALSPAPPPSVPPRTTASPRPRPPACACCWPRTIRSTPCWPAPCWSAKAARSIASPAATRPSRPCPATAST
jgi:hypothetical protein